MPLSVLSKKEIGDESRNSSSQSIFPTRLAFKPGKLIRWLLRIAGVLVICHLLNLALGYPSWQLERLFNLGYEANIPTWFSSVYWAIAFVAAYQCVQLTGSKLEKRLWIVIAFGFLAFSIDETAQIHENIFRIVDLVFPKSIQHEIFVHFKRSNWPVIASPFLVVTLISLGFALKRLLKSSFRAAARLGFGFFMIILGGWGLEITINFLNHDTLQWVWEIENVIEESLEMFGAILIISGLFVHHQVLKQREAESL